MAVARKKPLYVFAGSPAVFDKDLRVKVHVLGPPTLVQSRALVPLA